MEQQHQPERNGYDRNYKKFLILPAVLLILSIGYLAVFNQQQGDVIYKDVSLTGGTTITVFDSRAEIDAIKQSLKSSFPDIIVRKISDIRTGKQHGFFVETTATSEEIKKALELRLGYSLTNDNSSTEFTGSGLSKGFYQQLRNALIAAFLLMSWVIFAVFGTSRKIKAWTLILTITGAKLALSGVVLVSIAAGAIIVGSFCWALFNLEKRRSDLTITFALTIFAFIISYAYSNLLFLIVIGAALLYFYVQHSIPSVAVITAAFADIVMTIVVIDLLHIQLSGAGIVALLMLIGYSVDTDVLLTTRLLRQHEGSLNNRLWESFKTGMTMTLTAIAAVSVSLIIIYQFSDTLRQMFTILLIGLFFDIFNTWVTNASLLKWYMEAKHKT